MTLRRCSNLHTGEEENGKRMRNNDECDGANSCCRQMYLLPPFKKKKNSSFAVPALPFVSTKRRLHCLHHFLFSTHALFEVATHTTRNLSCCASRPVFSFCTHGKSAAYKEESDGRKPTTRPLKKKNGKTKLVAAYKHVAIRTARECVTHSSVLLQQHPIILFYFPFSSLARFAITAPFFFFWFA